MFNNQYRIEDDLLRLARDSQLVSVALAKDGRPMFSAFFEIEKDLLTLVAKRLTIAPSTNLKLAQLLFLSEKLDEIEKPTFKQVGERLQRYQNAHPRSPLFSAGTLFGPIDHARRETAFTRALAWLMDSSQPHGFGIGISNLILQLAPANTGKKIAEIFNVTPERPTAKGRRADIWAEGCWDSGEHWTLIIEAKIDAQESNDQLRDYENELEEETQWTGVFLTPEGVAPSSHAHDWLALSFLRLADALTAYYLTVDKEEGADFLRLFTAGLLRDVLRKPVPVTAGRNNRFEIADLMTFDLEKATDEK